MIPLEMFDHAALINNIALISASVAFVILLYSTVRGQNICQFHNPAENKVCDLRNGAKGT